MSDVTLAKAPGAFGFLTAWLADPFRVASIAPSSKALSGLIAAELSPATGYIIELGAGTGAITDVVVARGVPEENLALIELDTTWAAGLRQRFPRAQVFSADACRFGDLNLFGGAEIGAVICGLPLLSMPTRSVMTILDASFERMRPGGALYQLTYGPNCPIRRPVLDRLGLKGVRVGHTWANLPPASVYRITRRGPRPLRGNGRGGAHHRVNAVSKA
ncbi:SAM-dependent methyltransferase [Agaricicola taiwanensis]|uniref:SAM-dependent methyltransferase n=1 Tax=Agaricicola taiwanensis TaxID=591372 RepID=A0A8J2YK84_9RHOB|nr:hypothetical protein [Agaricicola taiwanensis]GGE49107.1 SAM-dependent methyltransferase [Agaricicola taiwanensis]